MDGPGQVACLGLEGLGRLDRLGELVHVIGDLAGCRGQLGEHLAELRLNSGLHRGLRGGGGLGLTTVKHGLGRVKRGKLGLDTHDAGGQVVNGGRIVKHRGRELGMRLFERVEKVGATAGDLSTLRGEVALRWAAAMTAPPRRGSWRWRY